jgi:hypothetical protein
VVQRATLPLPHEVVHCTTFERSIQCASRVVRQRVNGRRFAGKHTRLLFLPLYLSDWAQRRQHIVGLSCRPEQLSDRRNT